MAALENAGRLPASAYKGSKSSIPQTSSNPFQPPTNPTQKATMYTTLSPCSMCTGACLLYNIPRVVLGENSTFQGGEDLLRSHGVEVVNVRSQECVDLMRKAIELRPNDWWVVNEAWMASS